MKTILNNCTVFDGAGSPAQHDRSIMIEDGCLQEIGPAGRWGREGDDSDEHIIDLAGGFVIPGLWNVHAHPFDLFPDSENRLMTESAVECTIRAGRDLMDALKFGVTSVRVAGERDFIDVAWREAFEKKMFPGPRIFACGHVIVCSAGHGWEWGNAVEADGPYEVRRAVREQLKHGVDQIKIAISDAAAEFLEDEILAVVEVAHQKNIRVCAHAGGEGMKAALRAGVDCIEHGFPMDEEAIEMMKSADTFYDPTLTIYQDGEYLKELGLLSEGGSVNWTQCQAFARERESIGSRFEVALRLIAGRIRIAQERHVPSDVAQTHLEGVRKARDAGIKIVCGADVSPIGECTLLEVEHLVRAGLTENESLIAATRTSAELCGASDTLGTIEAGKRADLIVLEADPTEDIGNIWRQRLVMKDGGVVAGTSELQSSWLWQLIAPDDVPVVEPRCAKWSRSI